MSRSFQLFRLQQIDSQIDATRARILEIETALAKDAELQQAQHDDQAAANRLEQERKLLSRAEEAVQAQRVKIEQIEATLYGGKVRNPKELQDLQNEIAALKRYLVVLEDRQLEAMLSVEEAENGRSATTAALETAGAHSAQKNSRLTADWDTLSADLDRLETESSATASSILEEDLALYEKLRQQRRGVAVAKVTDRACSACGSTLNAALLHAARSPSQISRCDVCGRILYGG